jgi:methylglutaconyl-CoA hydratase
MGQYTKLTIENGVARLLLDRADKRNALKRETLEEISAAVAAIEGDQGVRVVILEAAGAAFCAGMDLGEMQSRAESAHGREEWTRDSQVYRDALRGLFELPVPTVAVVGGAAVAGGVGLVLACDLVLASTNAFFFLPEPMRGITAAMVTPLLVYRVGAGPAGQLLLSGERWTAETARSYGLCLDVVEEGQLAQRTEALVKAIFAGSRESLAITKRHLYQMSGMALADLLEQSMRVSAAARETGDAREGLAAFLEKRKPNWQPES